MSRLVITLVVPKRKDPDKRQPAVLSAWVDRDLYEQFKAIAESEHRSISGQIAMLITEHVKDYDERKAAA